MNGLGRGIVSKAKIGLAFVTFGTAAYGAHQATEYKELFPPSDSVGRKKNILVLPFHKMKIVEQKKDSLTGAFNSLKSSDDKVMEIELRELIDAIHAAAADPDVIALYGTFGDGGQFQCGGYAHVEEIRNAIRVFNESHRRHGDGNGGAKNDNVDKGTDVPVVKMSYAYADTFEQNTDSVNQEYFLASAFSRVYLQPRGNLNLFGSSLSSPFISDFLQRNGIKAHVFKHGIYKNAPNTFIKNGFTKAHRENMKAIIECWNDTVYASIAQSRRLPLVFDRSIWNGIHNYGTITADNAKEIHIIDQSPKIDPLVDLVEMNKNKKWSESLRKRFDEQLGKHKFEANQCITLSKYAASLRNIHKWQKRKANLFKKLQYANHHSAATRLFLGGLGLEAPYFGFDKKAVDSIYSKMNDDEKIAIVHVGPIDNKMSKKVVRSLREIKYDEKVKAVILRVDSPGGGVVPSETILENLKDLKKPVICSFSNLAASGGYYVAMSSKKIFTQQSTLTGSIGVYGIKFDASEAAANYGIRFDSVSSGDHAMTYSIFQPLTKKMEMNQNRNIDRVYSWFKKLVSEGRQMPLTEVEAVAQGRVWTGRQAKEVGLCDEFGGLDKAISFCRKEFTSKGFADVSVYPKPKPFLERLTASLNSASAGEYDKTDLIQSFLRGIVDDISLQSNTSENIFLCMDEEVSLNMAMQQVLSHIKKSGSN